MKFCPYLMKTRSGRNTKLRACGKPAEKVVTSKGAKYYYCSAHVGAGTFLDKTATVEDYKP